MRTEEIYHNSDKVEVNHLVKIISETGITKASISEKAESILSLVKNGSINPMEAIVKIAAMVTMLEEARQLISDDCLDEVRKYGKEATYKGVKLEVKEVGTKYDYSACGHPDYDTLKIEKEKAEGNLKALEATLKTLQKKMTIASDLTGEICEVNPPAKSSKTSVVVTIPKA